MVLNQMTMIKPDSALALTTQKSMASVTLNSSMINNNSMAEDVFKQ